MRRLGTGSLEEDRLAVLFFGQLGNRNGFIVRRRIVIDDFYVNATLERCLQGADCPTSPDM